MKGESTTSVAGGPCDNLQVVNLYSSIIRHGRLVSRSITVNSSLSHPPQLFKDLVQTGEVVVDCRSVLFATHRLQHKGRGQTRNQGWLTIHTVVLMQSYNAFADSAHVPVVVISFFAAQQPSIVASSGAQRLTAASAKQSENAQNNRQ